MKLNINEGQYYYREAKNTYYENNAKFSYLVFKCIGFNKNNTPKTERVAGFYYEEDAKSFCDMMNQVQTDYLVTFLRQEPNNISVKTVTITSCHELTSETVDSMTEIIKKDEGCIDDNIVIINIVKLERPRND